MPKKLLARPLLAIIGATALGFASAVVPAVSSASAHGRAGVVPAVGVNPPRLSAGPAAAGAAARSGVVFGCQQPGAEVTCYGPKQMRHAYGTDKLIAAGYDGSGQTIVIVDAYQSPRIHRDLKAFDDVWGLPAPDFRVVAPDGLTPFDNSDPNQVGWAAEISLDVEWAHAIAPGAAIVLVLAKSSNDNDIQSAVKYAVDHRLGNVLSQSFGEAESCYGVNADGTHQPGTTLAAQHRIYQAAANKKMTVFASAGDSGSAEPTCDGAGIKLAASTPASDPLVTSVGGTKLFANPLTGAYNSEIVWNEQKRFGARTVGGGGFSAFYDAPAYQHSAGDLPGRGVPDVSYDAAIDGGVVVAFSAAGIPAGSFFIFAGTSSGSPQWAALAAIGNQLKGSDMGDINPALYSLAASSPGDFHDITKGDNHYGGISGFTAGSGWDAASGLGSPRADRLLAALAGRG